MGDADLHTAAQALSAVFGEDDDLLALALPDSCVQALRALRAALAAAPVPDPRGTYEPDPGVIAQALTDWHDLTDDDTSVWLWLDKAGDVADFIAVRLRAAVGAPDEPTELTPQQIAGAAAGIHMAERIVPVHIPTPDEPTDDLDEPAHHSQCDSGPNHPGPCFPGAPDEPIDDDLTELRRRYPPTDSDIYHGAVSGRPYLDAHRERIRAHDKHQDKPGGSMEMKTFDEPDWLAVLVEEVGEVAKVQCDHRHGLLSDEQRTAELRMELVQVAAMTCAWIDAIDHDGRTRG